MDSWKINFFRGKLVSLPKMLLTAKRRQEELKRRREGESQ